MSITRETGIEGPRERYSLRSSLNTKCVSPARAGAHRGQERSAQEAGGGWVACSLNARMSARAIDFRNRLVAERDGRPLCIVVAKAGARAGRHRHGLGPGRPDQAALTSIVLGVAACGAGTLTSSMPLAYFASTWAASTPSGRVKFRSNAPYATSRTK